MLRIRETTVGMREIEPVRGGPATGVDVPEESLMLTGDENIVDVDFKVLWRISNAPDYLFNIQNPESTVKAIAESAMREIVGGPTSSASSPISASRCRPTSRP